MPRPGSPTLLPGPEPAVTAGADATRYGAAEAKAWPRVHQELFRRAGWEQHEGELPAAEGTLIRLEVEHLPGHRDPDPVWLWSSRAGITEDEADLCWQAFLRRFDLETSKPQCCHSRGSSALSSVPSRSVFMRAA